MVLGSDRQKLELFVAEVARPVPGAYEGGDVLVVVRVEIRDFSGAADAWIQRDSWSDFCAQLSRLERDRTGEAILESISPGELRLRFFAVDRAGHMAVDGQLTAYQSGPQITTLEFGAIEIDPTALPSLVRELENAVPGA